MSPGEEEIAEAPHVLMLEAIRCLGRRRTVAGARGGRKAWSAADRLTPAGVARGRAYMKPAGRGVCSFPGWLARAIADSTEPCELVSRVSIGSRPESERSLMSPGAFAA